MIPDITHDLQLRKTLQHGHKGTDIESGNPTFESIQFDLTPSVTAAEGKLYWNSTDGTLNLGMPGGNVVLQLGQEQILRVRNGDTSTINNGDIVYISGSTGDFAEVKKANASAYATSFVLGMATESISSGNFGFVTYAGLVRDVNTLGMTYGTPIWLATTAGGYTQTQPDAPNLSVFIGYPIRISATEGIIVIRPVVVPRLQGLSDVNGTALTTNGQTVIWNNDSLFFDFVDYIPQTNHYTGFPNRTATTISWDDGTYTLTLAGTGFGVWINGIKYTSNTIIKQLSVAQEAVSGLYWFWITQSAGTLTLNASTVQPGFDKCLVATVYWNTTTNKGIVSDERHWMGRDRYNHEYLHETIGARYASGFAGTFTNTTITIGTGEFYDEDIEHIITQQTSCNVFYKNGSADWQWDTLTTPYKVVNPGVDNTLQYNNGNSLASVSTSKYVNNWVFITANVDYPVVVIIGQAEHNTLALARAESPTSLSYGSLPSAETKLLFKITYQNSAGSPSYVEATDYRNISSVPTTGYVATDHGTLAGLLDDDHTQYLLVDGSRPATLITIDDAFTYIDKDGSGNMTFTDAVVGTKTLKELGCPTLVKLSATGQSAGSLNLTGFGVSKVWLKRLKVILESGTSTDFDIEIFEKDTFLAADRIYNLEANDSDVDVILDYLYEDLDGTDELHIKITDSDATGSPVFGIYLRGIELI